MNHMFKENIKEKMVQACGKQSIDILIKSFNRQIDNNTQFSSIDTVHVLNAVLESPKSMNEIILKTKSTNSIVNDSESENMNQNNSLMKTRE